MSEDIMPSGVAYTYTLLNKWEEISVLGEQYRELYLERRDNRSISRKYISKLTRMWLELYPKLEGRTEEDFRVLVENFKELKKFYYNPSLLLEADNVSRIYDLEVNIREALEKLNITRFEATEL